MKDIYKVLEELQIVYEKYDHPAVFTVAEAEKYDIRIEAAHTKNLFLTNKKEDKYYLVVVPSKKRADMKKLAKDLGASRLSFGKPEKLLEYLNLTPGSVSPFGLINDTNHKVTVVVDTDLLSAPVVGFHPNINTATLVVKSEDFLKFLKFTGNELITVKICLTQ